MRVIFFRCFAMLCLLTLCVVSVHADGDDVITISNGGVNYSLTAQALADMTNEVFLTMGYLVGLLYAVASLTAIYNATVIYIKLQAGEDGFTKSVMMLVGAILFLIGATVVLPAFFGYNAGSSGYSPFG